MSTLEIISLTSTFIGVTALSVVFTIIYHSYARSTVAKIQSGERDNELIEDALSLENQKIKRNKNILSAISTTFFILFMLIIIPFFLFALVARTSGDKPVFGKTFMVVASGSMSAKNHANDYLVYNDLNDQFKKYDIIILDAVFSPDDLKQYDVIAYRNSSGVIVIHRIISISDSGDGVRFIMRGDANNANDDYAPEFTDVIGVYRGKLIGAVGAIVMFLQSYSGIVTIAALLYCLIMIDKVSKKIEKSRKARLERLLSESDVTPQKIIETEKK